MIYYITKYALTKGVIRVTDSEANECGNDMLEYRPAGASFSTYLHGENKEWHKSAVKAIERSEDMRKRKIDSLKSSISKIEKMKFKVPE